MILTYYQSVELMAFLPVLLSPSDKNINAEITANAAAEENDDKDHSRVYQMWNTSTTGMEVNGADFF